MTPTPLRTDPLPSAPTQPPLTIDMKERDAAYGTTPPGAGGWCPKPSTVAMLSAAAAMVGGLAVSLPALLPAPAGAIAGAVCAALGLGLAALLGMRSAGPRSPT